MSGHARGESQGFADHWNSVFSREDPWNYAGDYEQRKYRHTLEMLPRGTFENALELGCAEGMFTRMLASKVSALTALDIADIALERARRRCADAVNVSFLHGDIADGLPGEQYDLVVCSEILYYLADRTALEVFARRVVNALAPGGHLLMTHANMVSDDRDATGFDFNEIGAKFIGEVFAGLGELDFECELRTDLYRVQRFRKPAGDEQTLTVEGSPAVQSREVLLREHAPFDGPLVKRGGCAVTDSEARFCWVSDPVPILMYHRVSASGPESLAPYRISPERFERQLAYLQRQGYRGMRMDEYRRHYFADGGGPVAGKRVVITFDDAYRDFREVAFPILSKYGFPAIVFVPTDHVGGTAKWDASFGEPAPIMGWDEIIELHGQGVEFGSHGSAHRKLNELDEAGLTRELVESKRLLEERLGGSVDGFCYPFTVTHKGLQAKVAQAGYRFAVSGTHGELPADGGAFNLRRIEVIGTDSMADFIARLPPPSPAPEERIRAYRELRARRDRRTYMKL